MTAINALFAGMAAKSAPAIGAALHADATMTAAAEEPDGSRAISHSTRDQFLARFTPGPERLEERLYDPAIEIDGDIAMVWGRYDFLIDGKIHHCGYDHFDLVREGGQWKILNVTWSQRTTGCAAG